MRAAAKTDFIILLIMLTVYLDLKYTFKLIEFIGSEHHLKQNLQEWSTGSYEQ